MINKIIVTKNDVELDPDLFDIKIDQKKGTISFNNAFFNLMDNIKITYYTTNEKVKKEKSKALYKYNKFEKLNFLPMNR